MPSTTVTSFLGVLALTVLLPGTAPAGDGVERLIREVRAISGEDLVARSEIRRRCGSDIDCAAHLLADALGPKARLQRVRHPSTDQIRWVRSLPSVTLSTLDENRVQTIALARFGRKVVPELTQALRLGHGFEEPVEAIVLDLRTNRGGDFDRMLRTAALFTGPVPDAVFLVDGSRTTGVAIPEGPRVVQGQPLRVLVSPKTASSAEVLAALLKVHAGAEIVGSRTVGKDYISRVVPVSHDLRLLVPAETIVVPGAPLAGGLVPDVPIAP